MVAQENVPTGLLDIAWKWINVENTGVSRLLQGFLECIVNLQEGFSMSLFRLTGPLRVFLPEESQEIMACRTCFWVLVTM